MSISAQEALNLLKHEDILVLGKMADKIRQQKHPDNVVSFVVDRNINYTNICTSECKFCAFYRKEENSDTYVLSNEVIMEKIKETIEAGGTQIMLQGGLNPNLRLGYYVDLLKMIKRDRKRKTEIFLNGPQGNAFYLIGFARKNAKQLGLDPQVITDEMTSGDYENLVSVFDNYFGKYVILYR